jgi:hypothetical protein
VDLTQVDDVFNADMPNTYKKAQQRVAVEGKDFTIGDGDVMIAAITELHQHLQPRRAGGGGSRRQEGG